MRRDDTRQRGFTLIEILVALVVVGMVVLLAHGIFAAASDGIRSLRVARSALDRSMNAHRWLAMAFQSLEVGQAGSLPFEGTKDRVTFSSRLMTAQGRVERRLVSLSRDGAQFVASGGGDDPLILADSVVFVAFDYLLETGADARWMAGWSSPVSAPLAVRLRLVRATATGTATDTSLFLIKERG